MVVSPRFLQLAGVVTINDPQAVGSDLATKGLHRSNIVITSVKEAPDIETALKSNTLVQASASQDPWKMVQTAAQVGCHIMNGKNSADPGSRCRLISSRTTTSSPTGANRRSAEWFQ